jgi:hypothetical protein
MKKICVPFDQRRKSMKISKRLASRRAALAAVSVTLAVIAAAETYPAQTAPAEIVVFYLTDAADRPLIQMLDPDGK